MRVTGPLTRFLVTVFVIVKIFILRPLKVVEKRCEEAEMHGASERGGEA
jgi:hypothetical protein